MRPRLYSRGLKRFMDKWPGKKTFGVYRFLPVFFFLGAALEFSMINWHVGEVNFYRVFKKRQAEKLALESLQKEQLEAQHTSCSDQPTGQ